jgi:hypothetical protein
VNLASRVAEKIVFCTGQRFHQQYTQKRAEAARVHAFLVFFFRSFCMEKFLNASVVALDAAELEVVVGGYDGGDSSEEYYDDYSWDEGMTTYDYATVQVPQNQIKPLRLSKKK